MPCAYYADHYLPRINFIQQLRPPAIIYKGLYIWGGNKAFLELCSLKESELPGMGMEKIFHPESLQTVISSIRKRAIGDPNVPVHYSVFLSAGENGRLKTDIAVYPLWEPDGTHLLLVENGTHDHSHAEKKKGG
jgi:hypothetical protein